MHCCFFSSSACQISCRKESRLPSLTRPLQEDPFLVVLLAGSVSYRLTGAPLIPHQATPVTGKLACSIPGPDTEKEAAPRPATKPISSCLYRQLLEVEPQPEPPRHPQRFKYGGCVMRRQTREATQLKAGREEPSHLCQYGTAAPSGLRIKAWLSALDAAS